MVERLWPRVQGPGGACRRSRFSFARRKFITSCLDPSAAIRATPCRPAPPAVTRAAHWPGPGTANPLPIGRRPHAQPHRGSIAEREKPAPLYERTSPRFTKGGGRRARLNGEEPHGRVAVVALHQAQAQRAVAPALRDRADAAQHGQRKLRAPPQDAHHGLDDIFAALRQYLLLQSLQRRHLPPRRPWR
jgi:hypothetical protein